MVVIFSIVQLETSFIFFSASDKSLAQWHTPKNLHRNRGPGKPVGIMVKPVVEFSCLKDQSISGLLVLVCVLVHLHLQFNLVSLVPAPFQIC